MLYSWLSFCLPPGSFICHHLDYLLSFALTGYSESEMYPCCKRILDNCLASLFSQGLTKAHSPVSHTCISFEDN